MEGDIGEVPQDRDIFGLNVRLGAGAAWPRDAELIGDSYPREANVRIDERLFAFVAFDVNDADAAWAIERRAPNLLTFVGDNQLFAILSEGDGVGPITRLHILHQGETACCIHPVEAHQSDARSRAVILGGEGNGQQGAVGSYRLAVVKAEGSPLRRDNRRRGIGGVGHLQGVATTGGDDKKLAAHFHVGGDLRLELLCIFGVDDAITIGIDFDSRR